MTMPDPKEAARNAVRPDDQQNVGADELPAKTSFRVADQQRVGTIAKTDNGRGVTSAGGAASLVNPDATTTSVRSPEVEEAGEDNG
jgi:hypothetical protein